MPRSSAASVSLVAAVSLAALSSLTLADDLPLGDGKLSSTPQAGYLMACQTHWGRSGGHGGPWIHGATWDPSQKPTVQGDADWPAHRFSISVQDGQRVVSGNDLPDHGTGIFPIQASDPAYQYDRNPNAIQSQTILLKLPLNPVVATNSSCVPMGLIGFATDGVAIFNAVDAGGADAAAHEVQDRCSGHPQQEGQYHYHSPSPCMPNEMTAGLVGYALDGFGIYGMKDVVTGRILHDADLDACHGTTSPVLWDGKTVDMYHYVLTPEYPYTVGCFRGTPVDSGQARGQGRPMAQGQGGGAEGGRRERLDRAAQKLGISPETLRDALGPPPPDLDAAARKLGISVEALHDALGPPPGGGD